MNIPPTDACYRMLARMAILDHIAAHSIRVCQVAMLLGERIAARGVDLNLSLINAAALLHDITKTRSFETQENHAETGESYLRDLGYPEVGDIVGQHVRLRVYADDGVPTAAEIVNYADKRVLHDKIVPLNDRMAYIVERYGKGQGELFSRIQWLWERSVAVEYKLFANLDLSPDKVAKVISHAAFDEAVETFQQVRNRQSGDMTA